MKPIYESTTGVGHLVVTLTIEDNDDLPRATSSQLKGAMHRVYEMNQRLFMKLGKLIEEQERLESEKEA